MRNHNVLICIQTMNGKAGSCCSYLMLLPVLYVSSCVKLRVPLTQTATQPSINRTMGSVCAKMLFNQCPMGLWPRNASESSSVPNQVNKLLIVNLATTLPCLSSPRLVQNTIPSLPPLLHDMAWYSPACDSPQGWDGYITFLLNQEAIAGTEEVLCTN